MQKGSHPHIFSSLLNSFTGLVVIGGENKKSIVGVEVESSRVTTPQRRHSSKCRKLARLTERRPSQTSQTHLEGLELAAWLRLFLP